VTSSRGLEPPGDAAEAIRVRKGPTYVGGFVGSFGGSLVPSLWGAGELSGASMLCFVIGGLAGIWLAVRLFA
jgi:hypothetical protein